MTKSPSYLFCLHERERRSVVVEKKLHESLDGLVFGIDRGVHTGLYV